MRIIIESAVKLDTDQQAEVEKLLAKKVESAEFVYKVNKAILGGLRVTIGSTRYDLSLAGKLEKVSQALA